MRRNDFVELQSRLSHTTRTGSKGVSLYHALRNLLEGSLLRTGERMPSSRQLAADLGLSRTTTETAYGRLEAEGYLVRRHGSGTYVRRTDGSPGSTAERQSGSPRRLRDSSGAAAALSQRGRRTLEAAAGLASQPRRIDPCTAEEELIPTAGLSRLFASALAESPVGFFRDLDPLGFEPLRTALARHLSAERCIDCVPEQIVITSGTQHSLSLLAALLLDSGDRVAFEQPGYLEARAAFRAAGAEILPVDIDDEGMSAGALARLSPAPRLVYLTPSHQYPLGIEMSAGRRREILEVAHRSAAFIVEDDYDSELRYEGVLETPLFTADRESRVFYCGTFNKALFASLRLGYLVVPREFSSVFRSIRHLYDGGEGFPAQAAMAEYIENGGYAGHLRDARRIFRRRRDLLVEQVIRTTKERLRIGPHAAGLHLCLHLPPDSDLRPLLGDDLAAQIGARPLADYYETTHPSSSGLVVGYGRLDRERIEALANLLALCVGVPPGEEKDS